MSERGIICESEEEEEDSKVENENDSTCSSSSHFLNITSLSQLKASLRRTLLVFLGNLIAIAKVLLKSRRLRLQSKDPFVPELANMNNAVNKDINIPKQL
ncbi:MAG: hypothetical protein EZS28_026387 [Streblomastix strix]|uniref:Uncharacterized protein n=1 Tax=Streblomastix strix TaxID=222440 RepID=A0A5J4V7H1_9EUKA|nr:MAG: hypothetical protein EZS28_026387 [Streblomastix strix]